MGRTASSYAITPLLGVTINGKILTIGFRRALPKGITVTLRSGIAKYFIRNIAYWREVVRVDNIPQRNDSDARKFLLSRGVLAKVPNSP